MRVRRYATIVALPVAAVMLVAGCSSSGGSSGSGGSSSANGAITIDDVQPQNPLIPSNTNEDGGHRVVEAVFSHLVNFNVDTAKPEMNTAESITTTDAKNYDIKLKPGWNFQDGTPADAQSYVDAWNWAAYAPNGALNSSFFAPIKGYDDVSPSAPKGSPKGTKPPAPTAKTMSGLKVVSPTEFTVELSDPYSPFEAELGYYAFDPMPKVFFQDPVKFGRNPIGNGPFKFVEWNDNADIKVTRWDDFKGTKPKVKDVTYKIYQDQNAAYADLTSGNLDFQQLIPTADVAGDKYKTDLNNRAISKPILQYDQIQFPLYDPQFANPDLRKAISMAIDRAQITKVIFSGTRTPMSSFSSPGVDGYKAGTCGENCVYDPAKAKAALAKAGGFQGTLTLNYNADGDHKGWTEAACNNIKSALGINCVATPFPTFAAFRTQITGKKMTGMYRSGWQYDYPNIEDGLSPIFGTGGSSNNGGYSNPAFDAALKSAAAMTNLDQSNAAFANSETLLANDMPDIPLWSYTQQSGYSEKVGNVKVDAFGFLDLTNITANS